MRILAIGDVCGEIGMAALARALPTLSVKHKPDLTIVNAENADVVGLRNEQAERVFALGVDIVTLGNHAWNRVQITKVMENKPQLLRPLNFSANVPGAGYIALARGGLTVGVACLIGRCHMDFNNDNPFTVIGALTDREKPDLLVVEIHAEATSEKAAMAYHLDGRVAVLYGTHTHVQTCDERIFPGGLGFITDIGMTGAYDSILGVKPQMSLQRFLGGLPYRYETPANGLAVVEGALFTIQARACTAIERVREFVEIG